MKNLKFDIVFIGGGAGGLFGASVAKALGAKACIIDKKRLGGDCTWYGCVPSKALLKSSQVACLLKNASQFGLKTSGALEFEYGSVMDHVRDVVNDIAKHHEPEDFQKRGIEIIIGTPEFTGPLTLKVNGDIVRAKKFVICTGSHPLVPPIEGLSDIDYHTNETIFSLNELPESMIVLGGGPIGIELSQALHRLGVKVSVVEMMDRILFREDEDVARILEKQLIKDGLTLYTGEKAVKFTKTGDANTVVLENKQGVKKEISAESILVAVGRSPNVHGLDLEKAGVEYDAKGLKVNDFLQTTNPKIFGCGDVAVKYQFTHVASYTASVAVRNALFRRVVWQKVNFDNVTWATFTDPELSHLGLTEQEARVLDRNIKVYTSPYTGSDRSATDLEKDGLVKIITNKKDRIVGAHIVGSHAGELMQGLLIAKSQKIPLSKIAGTMFIYPTLSELIKKTAAQPLVAKANHPVVKGLIKLMKEI